MTLYKRVEETIRRYEMVKKGDRVLVAVSGGPDSVFLLDALYNLRDKLGITLFVANLDHGIRGIESRTDSRFVEAKARRLALKFIHKRFPAVAGSRQDEKDQARREKPAKRGLSNKLSQEENLRIKRYKFFKEAAKKVRANTVATGHTLDDQAETVLMRVIKGATIKGLGGIPPVGTSSGLHIIRPLIEIEKRDILDFLKKESIPYRIDSTNLGENYFRNIIRNRVLPYLERYNPRIKRSLSLMADSLREDRSFIEEEKRKRDFVKKNGRYYYIRLKDIVVQPRSLQREILRDALMESGANIKRLTYRHWKDMHELLMHKQRGKHLDLPGGIVLKKDKSVISFHGRA